MEIKKSAIFIIFIFLFSGAVLAMDAQLWNAPLLPDAAVIWKDKPLNIANVDARATLLRSKMGTQEILEFYERALVRDGWKIKDIFGQANIEAFTKDNNYMYVAVKETNDNFGRYVYLASSAADMAVCRMISANGIGPDGLLLQDTPGKDLVDVPRYPASKRIINIFSPQEGDSLTYQAQANINDVVRFYQASLKPTGWKLADIIDPDDPKIRKNLPTDIKLGKNVFKCLDFEKGADRLSISVISLDSEGKTCLIMIVKNNMQSSQFIRGG